ncbi:Mus7/MMS22 family-domain-containing protein [Xylariales sp. PMI_506]|nr:Mus7/MMS22 family-domain-containing protein [Xylariales sp. PMI_506]
MATWKELGEVPDSDDESILDNDGDNNQPQVPVKSDVAAVGDASITGDPAGKTVWDLPLSSQESENASLPGRRSAGPNNSLGAERPSRQPSLVPSISPKATKESLRGYVLPDSVDVLQITSHAVPVSSGVTLEVVQEEDGGRGDLVANESMWTQRASAPIGRSLRPRKPIQEHPYLLESVQYSKLFKSHGVRPIKLPTEEARQGRAQEEDSQELDYEDDSQLTAPLGTQDPTEESQDNPQVQWEDDRDELALSSPVRPDPVSSGSANDDDDDLPSLDDLFKNRSVGRPKNAAKRKGSPRQSSKRRSLKYLQRAQLNAPDSPIRRMGLFEVPPSPPQTSPAFDNTTPVLSTAASRPGVGALTPKPSSANTSRHQTPAPATRNFAPIDLTDIPDLSSSDTESGSITNSESEPALNNQAGNEKESELALQRRIRGVLPASWIRLDQQLTRNHVQKSTMRPGRSPERTQRKGVAQPRRVSPKPGNDMPFFFDGDSEDDDMTLRNNDIQHNISAEPPQEDFSIFEDDAGSVIEEDVIDHMAPGTKRRTSGIDDRRGPKRRKKTQTTFSGRTGERKHQQKISGLLGRSKSNNAGHRNRRTPDHIADLDPRNYSGIIRSKPAAPVRLSILDVVEPNAPDFIRIAARAANRRPDKGRASPSHKQLSLGVRKDNLDALGILKKWRDGKIPPRLPLLTQDDGLKRTSVPLESISGNLFSPPVLDFPSKPRRKDPATGIPVSRFTKSRRLVKQTNMDRFVQIKSARSTKSLSDEAPNPTPEPIRRLLGRSKSHTTSSRPAQLEISGNESMNGHVFHVQKRLLDALYRRSKKDLPLQVETRIEKAVSMQLHAIKSHTSTVHMLADPSEPNSVVRKESRRRYRKSVQPRPIDTTKAQYTHANDPIPEDLPLVEVVLSTKNSTKLQGLGPFGSHYTQHFEIFPLDHGVFFHESTILGQGKVSKVFSELVDIPQFRPHCNLMLDGKALRWGPWEARTSSELGLLFDWILDKLQPNPIAVDCGSTAVLTVTQASDFVLMYLQDFVSFPDSESGRLFVTRILEVISGFLERTEPLLDVQSASMQSLVEVLTRCLLSVVQVLRICEKSGFSDYLSLEELVKRTSTQMVTCLLRTDLIEVHNLYLSLQTLSDRERGIRNDQYSVIGWVVLIRILQESRVPRLGFWDVVSSIMLKEGTASITDAQLLERCWRHMFTLLPLGEFDNTGVAIPGLRRTIPLEGWTLPQRLLSRVLDLYKASQQTSERQSPSFNDYCRTLLSRCHYLVDEWGWRKSSAIIGTIFDFFASQNLSHLRNEEVYQSPQFLEDLTGSPSLSVQPEDRCFHIFLKLLALSIRRLRRFGLIKDVRNLIARVLPNHNRQYLKEQDIHENELASLRNHHDLLCTLYWCSPQALRPPVHALERLVVPGSSHKEACLINLRAWNQLARFVVFSGEGREVYKPFADWQNGVFKQVLDQYSSVESDIQQQFLSMTKDAPSSVSPELMKRVISMNKQAATDVLHFSLRANLDVLCHAPSLGAASFVLNTYQLHEIYARFSFSPPNFDWSSLQVALDTTIQYLERVERFLDEQTVNTEPASSWYGEDAIMVLDRNIAAVFFSMARTVLSETTNGIQPSSTDGRAICLENVVVVAGRLAVLFVRTGVVPLSSFFASGKYCLFGSQPNKLSLHSRKYLCSFITTLVEKNILDFSSINTTPVELFLCAITKPFGWLSYENKLAEALKKHEEFYLEEAVVYGGMPDYPSNRDLFAQTLSAMRKSLRTENSSQRQHRQAEFSKAIRTVQDQMKQDLRSIVEDASAHSLYIQFVRSVVPLIKTNDFCPVDQFFYGISREYSPSVLDPRLQAAAILSYGLKLEDKDMRALHGLFYFLYPNFKLAMANGKLGDECSILREGAKNRHVFSFIISRMLPAITKTAVRVPAAWLLLEVYVTSLDQLLSSSCVHREIGDESMHDLVNLIKFATSSVHDLQQSNGANFGIEYIQTLIQVARVLNLFRPSLSAFLSMPRKLASDIGLILVDAIESFTNFTRTASVYLYDSYGQSCHRETPVGFSPARLLEGAQYYDTDEVLEHVAQISGWVAHMVEDMRKNWTTTDATISVRGPARHAGIPTQSGQGTKVPTWSIKELAIELLSEMEIWNSTYDQSFETRQQKKRQDGITEDDLIF